MNPIISVFFNILIISEGAEDAYLIKKIVITIFIFIINKYNYKIEIINF